MASSLGADGENVLELLLCSLRTANCKQATEAAGANKVQAQLPRIPIKTQTRAYDGRIHRLNKFTKTMARDNLTGSLL